MVVAYAPKGNNRTSSQPPMIETENISKHYGTGTVLNDITLRMERGTATVIIGPSGGGKSTLLRIIMGLVKPDCGRVRIDGELLTPGNALTLRRKMGYVIQEGGLFPHLTAHENVSLMARYLQRDEGWIKGRVTELAQMAKLPEEALHRYPVELSGGQRQRVSVMRALMLEPDILLMDEPLGALDPMIRYDLQGDLKGLFQGMGKTVVMVTHDIGEAAYFGDTVVILNEGAIVQKGTIGELVRNPKDPFVTSFIKAQRQEIETL